MYAVSDWLCVVGLVHLLTETENSPLTLNSPIRASLHLLTSFYSASFSYISSSSRVASDPIARLFL